MKDLPAITLRVPRWDVRKDGEVFDRDGHRVEGSVIDSARALAALAGVIDPDVLWVDVQRAAIRAGWFRMMLFPVTITAFDASAEHALHWTVTGIYRKRSAHIGLLCPEAKGPP